jgi:hypothetical protein
VAKTTSSRTRQFSFAFTLRKASGSTERKGVSPGLESNLPGCAPSPPPQIFCGFLAAIIDDVRGDFGAFR